MARMKQKYRVISQFTYKGRDGHASMKKWVVMGPGEKCPPLESNERERLIMIGAICEVSSVNGHNIISKKLTKLNAEQIETMFQSKSPQTILLIVQTEHFDKDTLTLMIVWAEKMRMPPVIAQTIESKLNG